MHTSIAEKTRPNLSDDWDAALKLRFGLESFRPWQREAIQALLKDQRSVLVVAPTGGGKSLCYQFPATVLEGTSLVISPLIALMEDQVRALSTKGIAATWFASTLSAEERQRRHALLSQGHYKLVYVAPERLTLDGTLTLFARIKPALVAVDEAHCISQWGHDFRPDYLRIGELLHVLKPRHVLACTATATPQVRQEILTKLGLAPERTSVILRGFARPNLHLSARVIEASKERQKTIADLVKDTLKTPRNAEGAAVIYAATRRNAERLATQMKEAGWRSAVYHAGLEATLRAKINSDFAERKLDVMVATNAFGMGIDRSDIRLVLHAQAPGSIEAYYQEVGRAGRDGQPAQGVLLTSLSDFGLRRRLIELRSGSADAQSDTQRQTWQWKLFLDLMHYVEAGSCRHDFILRYFEDERELLGGCGHCDICEMLEASGHDSSHASVSEQDAVTVRKALAGVARVRGRAGLHAVADMLRGTSNARLQRLELHTLSTFGLLCTHSKEWLLSVLRRALTAGLIEVKGENFPVPELTPAGWAVMQGKEPVRMLLPDQKPKRMPTPQKQNAQKHNTPSIELNENPELFEALRTERKALATLAGVPAYIICHDRTLREIAARKPTSLIELGRVYGMGPARLEAHGAQFLKVVAACE